MKGKKKAKVLLTVRDSFVPRMSALYDRFKQLYTALATFMATARKVKIFGTAMRVTKGPLCN